MNSRVERVTGWIEYWTGELLDGQQTWLDRAIRNYPSMSDLWADYHSQQRQQLLLKVDEHASRKEMRGFLESWWSGTADRSAPFLGAVERFRAAFQPFAMNFGGILSSYQHRRVQSRSRGVGDDLESLMTPCSCPVRVARGTSFKSDYRFVGCHAPRGRSQKARSLPCGVGAGSVLAPCSFEPA